jgi:hypothetical protein
MGDLSNSGPDHAKACAEALQAAQKRVRLAFFLTMGASCIVLLMVINLANSLLIHKELIPGNSPDGSGYLTEYSKQVADQAFYQIPWLGIQISCDDVGLLGPAVLLVFSLYSFMTLRINQCHLKYAASDSIAGNLVINALLETEILPEDSAGRTKWIFLIPRWLQFLPCGVCLCVAAYCVYAHFIYVPKGTMSNIINAARPLARILDAIGLLIVAPLVALANTEAFKVVKAKAETAKNARNEPEAQPPVTNIGSLKTAGGAH